MKFLLIPLFCTFPFVLLAQDERSIENPYALYFGKVIRVIDGDTIIAEVDLWPGLTQEIAVRAKGIDAPELRRVGCEEERQWGEDAKDLVEKSYGPGTPIRLEDISIDSFGRAIADIRRWRSDRWLYLSNELVDQQLAVEWEDDQDDVPWCLLAQTREVE
ncbi:thermonuclease family protein [Maritimibacter alexandrii]|uniref:thermonuclease family protein n=1 Tax=Maritimibacter alexandrii TaxID=2570355 RepID=UPI001109AEA3|nr:thermonuclease family protein [Maritimibacter alexandrii]